MCSSGKGSSSIYCKVEASLHNMYIDTAGSIHCNVYRYKYIHVSRIRPFMKIPSIIQTCMVHIFIILIPFLVSVCTKKFSAHISS